MNDAHRLLGLTATAAAAGAAGGGGGDRGEHRGGTSDEADAIALGHRRGVPATDPGVGEHAVAEGEPAVSPPLPYIGPLAEDTGDGDGGGGAGIGRRIVRRPGAGAEAGAVEGDAAERVRHLPRPHRDREIAPRIGWLSLDAEIYVASCPTFICWRPGVEVEVEDGGRRGGSFLFLGYLYANFS